MKMQVLAKARRRLLLISVAVMSMSSLQVAAETYPAKPIRLIIPSSAGGGTDAIGRVLAQAMQRQSGVTVVVENKPGAGGSIGVQLTAQAAPDGYTILASVPDAVLVYPVVNEQAPYRWYKDLTPVAQLGLATTMLVVNGKSSIKTIPDLVTLSKTKPINYASPGEGTTGHLVTQAVLQIAGVKAQHVPYKGAAPALTSIVAGETDLFNTSSLSAGPLLDNGQVRAIAQLSGRRSALRPDVPTLGEFGVKGIPEEGWFGVFTPSGVPADRMKKLIQMISEAMQTPEYLAQAQKMDLRMSPAFGEEFRKIVAEDQERWVAVEKLIRSNEKR